MPGLAGAGMDEATQVRTVGRPLLPRRIHAAGADQNPALNRAVGGRAAGLKTLCIYAERGVMRSGVV